MHWSKRIDNWNLNFIADRVIDKFSRYRRPDKRFKNENISGQMQEIMVTAYKSGIFLKRKDLVELWKKSFKQKYELELLYLQRREILTQRKNLSRRLIGVNKQISFRVCND